MAFRRYGGDFNHSSTGEGYLLYLGVGLLVICILAAILTNRLGLVVVGFFLLAASLGFGAALPERSAASKFSSADRAFYLEEAENALRSGNFESSEVYFERANRIGLLSDAEKELYERAKSSVGSEA